MDLNATGGDVSNPHINIFSHRGLTNSSEPSHVPSAIKREPNLQNSETPKPAIHINPSFGEMPLLQDLEEKPQKKEIKRSKSRSKSKERQRSAERLVSIRNIKTAYATTLPRSRSGSRTKLKKQTKTSRETLNQSEALRTVESKMSNSQVKTRNADLPRESSQKQTVTIDMEEQAEAMRIKDQTILMLKDKLV